MSGPLTRPGETHGLSPIAVVQEAGGGSGDVVGPASSTDNWFALWDGTTGELLKSSQFPLDSSDNEYFKLASVASAVNELTFTNSATLGPPIISATGSDSNIGIQIAPKGSGILYVGDGSAGIDYELQFVGEDNSGILRWMEDEDYFNFRDGILMQAAEELYFRATTQRIYSSGAGILDIDGTTLRLNPNNPGNIILGDSTQRDIYPQTDKKMDLGSTTNWFNEGWIHQLHVQQSVANVASPPTDAELDSAFGTPATLGRGFVGTVDDNDGDATMWICVTSDASWYYVATTKAV